LTEPQHAECTVHIFYKNIRPTTEPLRGCGGGQKRSLAKIFVFPHKTCPDFGQALSV